MQVFESRDMSNVLLFLLDIRLFSAYRRVKSEDIKAAKGVDLAPDAVLTLGSQKVLDKGCLNVFQRYKDRAIRALLAVGTPFLTGYAVPAEKAEAVAKVLDEIFEEALQAKAQLVKEYPERLEAFCAANAAWGNQIRAKAFTAEYIEAQIKFAHSAVRFQAPCESGPLANGVMSAYGGLLGDLLLDVGQSMRRFREQSLCGKAVVTRKALRPLKSVREKLLGFTFLDPRLQSVADMIQAVITHLPDDGPIVGADLAMLFGITGILVDPAQTMQIAAQFQQTGESALLTMVRPGSLPVIGQLALANVDSQELGNDMPEPVSEPAQSPAEEVEPVEAEATGFGWANTLPQADFSSLFAVGLAA